MRWVLLIAVAAVAVTLSACGPGVSREEYDRSINNRLNLPEGCTYHYAGRGSDGDIELVICNGKQTVSLNKTWRSGKTHHHTLTVMM